MLMHLRQDCKRIQVIFRQPSRLEDKTPLRSRSNPNQKENEPAENVDQIRIRNPPSPTAKSARQTAPIKASAPLCPVARRVSSKTSTLTARLRIWHPKKPRPRQPPATSEDKISRKVSARRSRRDRGIRMPAVTQHRRPRDRPRPKKIIRGSFNHKRMTKTSSTRPSSNRTTWTLLSRTSLLKKTRKSEKVAAPEPKIATRSREILLVSNPNRLPQLQQDHHSSDQDQLLRQNLVRCQLRHRCPDPQYFGRA